MVCFLKENLYKRMKKHEPRYSCKVWRDMETAAQEGDFDLNEYMSNAEDELAKDIKEGRWPIEVDDKKKLGQICFYRFYGSRDNLVECKDYIIGSSHSLIYVANEECLELNDLFEKFLYEFNIWANSLQLQVIYIPSLVKKIQDIETIRYRMPWMDESIGDGTPIGNDYMLRYLLNPEDRKRLKHGFFYCRGEIDPYTNAYIGYYHELKPPSEENLLEQLAEISAMLAGEIQAIDDDTVILEFSDESGNKVDNLDDYLPALSITDDIEIQSLIEEVREKILQLRLRGVGERILEELMHPHEKLSRLIVTHDNQIILPEYRNMEIKLEPLVKAVYLLFLKHPEGIMFKQLPDYREELTEIYLKLKPNGLTDRVKKSIEDVTNPMLNSINEKCARIRSAFLDKFDKHLAQYYYIVGERATPKKIELSRDLVVWEA